jgi:hypothetical protein
MLFKQIEGKMSPISESIQFEVVPLHKGSLESMSKADVAKFWRELERLDKDITATDRSIRNGVSRVVAMQNALTLSNADFGDLYVQLEELRLAFAELNYDLGGNPAKAEVGALSQKTIWERYNVAVNGVSESTYGPTPLHLENIEIAIQIHQKLKQELLVLLDDKVPAMERELEATGAPWIQGQDLPKD